MPSVWKFYYVCERLTLPRVIRDIVNSDLSKTEYYRTMGLLDAVYHTSSAR